MANEGVFTPDEVEKPAEGAADEGKKPDEKPPAGEEKPKPDLDPLLQGDHIPEKYRGKKASQIAADNARLEAELAEAKRQPAPQQQVQRREGEPKPVNEMTIEEIEQLGYQNPTRAAAIIMQRFSAPIVQEVRATSKKLAEQTVQALPHYKRFEKEIKEHVAKAAPEAQGNPELHQRVYEMVVGAHHDELVREASTGGTGLPNGNAPKDEPKKVVLSDEQKTVAGKFNMSEEDYIKHM